MKKLYIPIILILFAFQILSPVMAKKPASVIENAVTDIVPTGIPLPTTAVEPTSVPVVTNVPAPTSVPQPQPTAMPVEPTQVPPQPNPTTVPPAPVFPTAAPLPPVGGNTIEIFPSPYPHKPQSNTTQTTTKNYSPVTQPSPAPVASTEQIADTTSYSTISVPEPIQQASQTVQSVTNTVAKVIPPPVLSFLKARQPTYYQDSTLSNNETLQIIFTSITLFIIGVFLSSRQIPELVFQKLAQLRTHLF